MAEDIAIKAAELELMLWGLRDHGQVKAVKLDAGKGWHSLSVDNPRSANLLLWLWENRQIISEALTASIRPEDHTNNGRN